MAKEIRELSDLTPASYNPRKIGKEAASGLRSSLDKFGDISGIVFNARTSNLVSGHQRVAQLKELGATVERKDGSLFIAHRGERFRIREVDWDIDTETQANITANNPHIAGVFTSKVEDLLKELAVDVPMEDLEAIGLDKLMKQAMQESEEDEAPEPPTNPVSQPGNIWLLGKHQFVCGDSTNPEHVKAAMGELRPFIMVTDPPYGVKYDPSWRHDAGVNNSNRTGVVLNDEKIDWSDAYSLFTGDVVYVWHAGKFTGDVHAHIENCDFIIRSQIIWSKSRFVLSRGDYHWHHEPCWYAVRKGRKSQWCGDRTQSTIWSIGNHTGASSDKDDAQTTHGAQKPVECMARPMRNHGSAGDVVYDPFLGSGTSIIAAEQTERICVGLELNPAYADVIIERWQNFTGGKAQRIGGC